MAHLEKLLGKEVIGKDGKVTPVSSLVGLELLGLYISAHWCPPCRGFTPILAECYKKVTFAGKSFEIIFISLDKDIPSFKEYFDTMPWLALPFDSDLREQLPDDLGVSGIPALYFINPKSGKVITNLGREIVEKDRNGDNFPWK